MVVTKSLVEVGSTRWAQGGIAAALGAGDSPQAHMDDTLVAGAGLCDPDAVRVLVESVPPLSGGSSAGVRSSTARPKATSP